MKTHHGFIALMEKLRRLARHPFGQVRGNLALDFSHTHTKVKHSASFRYGESSVSSFIALSTNCGDPAQGFSHKRKSGTELDSETRRVFRERVVEPRANPAARGQQEALSRLSEAEFRTRILLEEERSQILSEARSEILSAGIERLSKPTVRYMA